MYIQDNKTLGQFPLPEFYITFNHFYQSCDLIFHDGFELIEGTILDSVLNIESPVDHIGGQDDLCWVFEQLISLKDFIYLKGFFHREFHFVI